MGTGRHLVSAAMIATVFASAGEARAELPESPVEAPRRVRTDAEDPQLAIARAFARLSAGEGYAAVSAELAPFVSKAGADQAIQRVVESHGQGKPPLRAELISAEPAGPSFVRLHYLLAYEKSPLVWSFTFRRVDGHWRVLHAGVTQDVTTRRDLFREAARAAADPDGLDLRTAGFVALIGTDDRAALESANGLDVSGSRPGDDSKRLLIDHIVNGRRALGWKHSGIELARHESLTPSLVRYVYVEHSLRDYMAWEFVFYRAEREWDLISLNLASHSGGAADILFPGSPLNPPTASAAPRR